MSELIHIGSLQLKFLHSKDDTGGSLDMFEMTLQPNARMPVPHHHESWDETVYGLAGTSSWNIDGKDIDVASGRKRFHQARRRSRLVQPRRRRRRVVLVYAGARRSRAVLFQGDGRAAGRWRARSGKNEGNHAALRAHSVAAEVIE